MPPTLESKKDVFEILQNLHGSGAPDALKELLWSRLSYERIDKPLPRRGWSETARSALVEDPVLFAAGGQSSTFHIITARLASDRLLLGPQRSVIETLLREHPYAMFVFSTADLNRWHFVNVKFSEETQRRRLFRRITVGPEERLRTASERIAMLDLEDLADQSPLAI